MSIDVLSPWVSLPLTVDQITGSSTPFNYGILGTTRDIATFNAFVTHVVTTVTPDPFAALQANDLLRPDPSDGTKFQVKLGLRIVYPSDPSQPEQIAGSGQLPLVLLNHGNHQNWRLSAGPPMSVSVSPNWNGYAYLQDALCAAGIMSVSIDHNFASFTNSLIETRADTLIAALNELAAAAASSSSRYFNRIDFSNIGLMGHSRGGDAVIRATRKIYADVSLFSRYRVKAICSLAPTDFTGAADAAKRMFLEETDDVFYLVVYGALDGDVFGNGANSRAGTGFRHYDRAQSQKAMVFLDNCCHNPFNSVWFADGNDSADSRLASPAEHQSIAVDYIGDLFRWQLNGENKATRLDGRDANSAAQHASQQWMFGKSLKQIDGFEDPSTNLLTAPRALLSGSAPTQIEDFSSISIGASTLEQNTAHETHVVHVDVTGTPSGGTRVLTTDIPAGDQDWSTFDTLIFSLSGWFDPTSDSTIAAANLPRLQVTLVDATNATASVDSSVYGTNTPSRPVFKTIDNFGNVTLMRLETVPITLSAFSGIDVTKIKQVALDIDPANNTHVFVDNIHVVARQ